MSGYTPRSYKPNRDRTFNAPRVNEDNTMNWVPDKPSAVREEEEEVSD